MVQILQSWASVQAAVAIVTIGRKYSTLSSFGKKQIAKTVRDIVNQKNAMNPAENCQRRRNMKLKANFGRIIANAMKPNIVMRQEAMN
ncbi:hypothetical protein GCK72_017238 [Caenorhabditis remanei]|uniref:Uncharacterized protein n=1 Tax=Caenorhabditis remanei TaxID=31234 RepID=A0A6A5G6R7_CAERE|nr:hypothetical protein GCK72_017238 [Caenorhabditis remanei]KAF1750687.1 hypothetical protein GCK72_017238 [Caenorhabditis remanei]